MRRGRDSGILFDDKKNVIGINLGADFTSEHEWGIKGLRALFGMNDAGLGLGKRKITKMPEYKSYFGKKETRPVAHLLDDDKQTLLMVCEHFEADKPFEAHRWELSSYGEQKLFTAWDEKSLGILATGQLEREAVRAIYTAMQKLDLAIWLGGGGVFQNAGLVLCIASRIPWEKAQALHDADVDRINLENAADKTGIKAKLEKADKRYYALSPKWLKGFNPQDKNPQSKHPVIYWLNPCDQHLVNFGWFTVEELEQWIAGKGPIPMTQAEIQKRAR